MDNPKHYLLGFYDALIICKYLDTVNDLINMEKCCKTFNGIIESFHFNPIPLTNERETHIFENLETYCFYNDDEEKEIKFVKRDKRLLKYIHFAKPIGYIKWKENKYDKNKHEFYNVQFDRQCTQKYLMKKENFGSLVLKKEDITFEERITSLGEDCFGYCSNISTITIPTSVTSIGNFCFSGCNKLKKISIPTSVSSIGDNCFYECKNLSTITIPSGVSCLGENCFYYCSSLRSVNIPSRVSSIGNWCFERCYSLTSVTIPKSVFSLGDGCFKGCSNLQEIDIPTSVTSIGHYSFAYCGKIQYAVIPLNVKSLGCYCFSNCTNLVTIKLPSSVESFGTDCFEQCIHIKKMKLDEGNPLYYFEEEKDKNKDTKEYVIKRRSDKKTELVIKTRIYYWGLNWGWWIHEHKIYNVY